MQQKACTKPPKSTQQRIRTVQVQTTKETQGSYYDTRHPQTQILPRSTLCRVQQVELYRPSSKTLGIPLCVTRRQNHSVVILPLAMKKRSTAADAVTALPMALCRTTMQS